MQNHKYLPQTILEKEYSVLYLNREINYNKPDITLIEKWKIKPP
jgi:hypothetical protein